MWAGADQTIAKYLARGAEPQARAEFAATGRYHSALVIPVRDERVDFLLGLQAALAAQPGALLIVVVNADPRSGPDALHNNQQLLSSVSALGNAPTQESKSGLTWVTWKHGAVLLVDCSSAGRQLPLKQGVGLARKIGCDIAINLWKSGVVTGPWLFSSDADVSLPGDYFAATAVAHDDAGALVFDFAHQASGDAELDQATFEYELYLRYYTLGLAWAGSPYAFHTLGSCLAIRAEAYAAVRGFPKREAGEDFHLLSKLAKIAAVQTLHQSQIKIAARRSLRTPFGTGARVATVLAGEVLEFYDPRLFRLLKDLLDVQRHWAQSPTVGLGSFVTDGEAKDLWGECLAVLGELGLDQALSHAAHMGRDTADRLRHLHTWFDALKTLRLLRAVQRRCGLRGLGWREALQRAPFVALGPTDLCTALEHVRERGRTGPQLQGLLAPR